MRPRRACLLFPAAHCPTVRAGLGRHGLSRRRPVLVVARDPRPPPPAPRFVTCATPLSLGRDQIRMEGKIGGIMILFLVRNTVMPDGFKVRRILPMMGSTDISQLKAIGVEADNRARTKIIVKASRYFGSRTTRNQITQSTTSDIGELKRTLQRRKPHRRLLSVVAISVSMRRYLWRRPLFGQKLNSAPQTRRITQKQADADWANAKREFVRSRQ